MLQKDRLPDRRFLIKHKGEISFGIALFGLILSSLLLTHTPLPYLTVVLILQTGFEAGTVGGAADWLAVKMIFDEIKIGRLRIVPASGIIPRKQKAIAQGAGKLVAEEWLSAKSVQDMLQSVDVADALAEYLERIQRNGELSNYVNWIIDHFVKALEKPAIQERLAVILKEQVTRVQWSEWIRDTMTEDRTKKLLDRLIPFVAEKLAELLGTKEAFDLVVEKLSEDQGGFLKQLFFDPVETAEKAILKSIQFLRELQDNPFHPVRLKIDERATAWISDLKNGTASAQAIDSIVHELISELDIGLFVKKAVDKIVQFLREQQTQKESMVQTYIQEWIGEVIKNLKNDAEWKGFVNEKIISVIGEIIRKNHHRIGEMVEKNLNDLSPVQIKEQFRARTYDDMQWIRVNGAVAGFAIGIVIGILRVMIFD